MSFRDYCRPESARTPSRASSSWALTEARDLARRGLIAGYAVETVAAKLDEARRIGNRPAPGEFFSVTMD